MNFTVVTVIFLMVSMSEMKPMLLRYRRMHMLGFQSRKYYENRQKTAPVDRVVIHDCDVAKPSPAKCKTLPSIRRPSQIKTRNATGSKTRTKDRRFGKLAGALVGGKLTPPNSSVANAR